MLRQSSSPPPPHRLASAGSGRRDETILLGTPGGREAPAVILLWLFHLASLWLRRAALSCYLQLKSGGQYAELSLAIRLKSAFLI